MKNTNILRAVTAIFVLLAFTSSYNSINAQTDVQTANKLRISPEQVERINKELGLSNQILNQLPESKIPRLIQKIEHPDLPRRRVEFRLLQERDETGNIPPDALPKALEQLDSLKLRSARIKVAGVPVEGKNLIFNSTRLMPPFTAGLENGEWQSIGPDNIGGRIRSIVIHPTKPNLIWIGSVGGGVWRSDDGGGSFFPVDDLMANLSISCMAIDPVNPSIIYAGTGEGFDGKDDFRRGGGIFRTLDGIKWERISSTSNDNFNHVNRLAISADGKTILAATPKGVFRSSDADRLQWKNVSAEPFADVDLHLTDSLKAVAGSLTKGNAYYSEDGGETWQPSNHLQPWSGRIEMTYAAANASIVYASVDINRGEIWKSEDGGKNYSKMGALLSTGKRSYYLGRQGWYDNVIWAGDTSNANLVIVGGIDLWRSMDGGRTIIDISTWTDSASAHADHHTIVSHPGFNGTTNKTVFFANDGGLYKTNNIHTLGNNLQPPRTNGWIRLVNGLSISQFYGGSGHPETGKIVGGTQDNGTVLFDPEKGVKKWVEISGGDGGWCAWDQTDAKVFYGEYVNLDIHRNTDGGATTHTQGDRYISGSFYNFGRREWDRKPFPYRIPDAGSEYSSLFIAPFTLDSNNSNRILAGGLSLWRTNDAKTPNTDDCQTRTPACGPKWESIKNSTGSRISSITIVKGKPDVIWVGEERGSIYKTDDGTKDIPVWQKMDDNGINKLPNRFNTRIIVDPSDERTVYVTFGGYKSDNVWKSIDGGMNWNNIGGNLPEAPVRSLAIHPRNSKYIYLGTEVGLFASENGGLTWSPTNEGPTSCPVDDLFWVNDELIAATHGRGMFRIKLSLPN